MVIVLKELTIEPRQEAKGIATRASHPHPIRKVSP